MQGNDPRIFAGQEMYQKEAQIRLNPFDQGRQDERNPDDPRNERHWFRRFWARLRGKTLDR